MRTAEQNYLGKEIKSKVIDRFREERKLRHERKAMINEALQHDDLVSWKDIVLSIGGLLFILGVFFLIAFTMPILELFFS